GDLLYVISAHKTVSEILVYQGSKKNGYSFKSTLASRDTVNSIFHPFDLTFDTAGHCYVSSQDSNVVTALYASSGKPLPVASYLQQQHPAPAVFLAGTFVASATGNLPGVPQPAPPDVATPQGLEVSYTDSTNSRVANSV